MRNNRFTWFTVRLVLAVIAFFAALLLTNHYGDQWETKLRNTMYAISGDSIPDFAAVQYDHRGVPFVIYAEENGIHPGRQWNATIVANAALDYATAITSGNHDAQAKFMATIHWLDSAMTPVKNDGAVYLFHWQQAWYPQVGVPFTSGMSSGRAIEAFVQAWQITGDSVWLTKASTLVNAFGLPLEQGGFTYREDDGWWYEEFADTSGPTPRVLDGHIFTLQGLQAFRKVQENLLADSAWQSGMQKLVHVLPQYDAGNDSIYYDADKKTADKKYHRLLVGQMQWLYNETGEPAFKTYYEKWGRSLWKPYLLRMVNERNKSGLLLFVVLWAGLLALLFVLLAVTKSAIGQTHAIK